MSAEAFYRYYDLLYSEKDYVGEAHIVLSLLRQRSRNPIVDILDVGCGTGRHAREFARLGCAVYGIDVEPDAITLAERNNISPIVTFACGTVDRIARNDFDGAVSLFNVVNYIIDDDALASMFEGIADRIRPGGAFVFDSWNGKAALEDPPREKISDISHNGDRARVALRPTPVQYGRYVTMDMDVDVTLGSGTTASFACSYRHRLWTPNELSSALVKAGLSDVRVTRWMSEEAATDKDWKIMFSALRE